MTVMLNAAATTAPVPATDSAPAGESGSAGTFAALLAQTADGSAPEPGDGDQANADPAGGSVTSRSGEPAADGRPASDRSRTDEQPADSSQVLAALLPMLAGHAVPADPSAGAASSLGAGGKPDGAQPAGSVSGIGSLPEAGSVRTAAGQVPAGQVPAGQVGVQQLGLEQVGLEQQASGTQSASAARPAVTAAGTARLAASAHPASTAPAGTVPASTVAASTAPAGGLPATAPAAGTPSGAASAQGAAAVSAGAAPKPASTPGTGRATRGTAPASASPATQPAAAGQPLPAHNPAAAQPVPNSPSGPASPSGPTSSNGNAASNGAASPNGTATAAAALPATQPAQQGPLDQPAGGPRQPAAGDQPPPVAGHHDKATGDAVGAVSLGQPDASTTTPAVPSLPPANQPQPTIQSQPASQSSAGQPTPTLAQPVAQQLSAPLLRLRASGDGSHSLTIALHPAELGPVNLHVKLAGDTMTIQLASTSESARDALRDALPQLHQELQAAGLPSAGLSLELGGHAAGGSAGFGTPEQQPHAPAQPAGEIPAGKPESRPRRAESGLDRWL